jgi:tRNA dimethylallyltransferase
MFSGGGVEIINADSMQVYRGMDIGTAKPGRDVLKRLPHRLLDVVDPNQQFNAGEFTRHADRLITEIRRKSGIPLVAGGAAYYLRCFMYGLPAAPAGAPRIRRELKEQLKSRGLSYLRQELEQVDPATAAALDDRDSYRIVRALEVYRTAGKPLSAYPVPREMRKGYRFLCIGLERPREELYRRIDTRVDRMFTLGLADEVRTLISRGYTAADPGMKGIGYREFFEMRKGCLNSSGLKALIKTNSRRYAKRQMTFFRSIPGVRWYAPEQVGEIESCIGNFWKSRQEGKDSGAGQPT